MSNKKQKKKEQTESGASEGKKQAQNLWVVFVKRMNGFSPEKKDGQRTQSSWPSANEAQNADRVVRRHKEERAWLVHCQSVPANVSFEGAFVTWSL